MTAALASWIEVIIGTEGPAFFDVINLNGGE
jgi:hypothetical protein